MNILFHSDGSIDIASMKTARDWASYEDIVQSVALALRKERPDLSETTHDMSVNLLKQVHLIALGITGGADYKRMDNAMRKVFGSAGNRYIRAHIRHQKY